MHCFDLVACGGVYVRHLHLWKYMRRVDFLFSPVPFLVWPEDAMRALRNVATTCLLSCFVTFLVLNGELAVFRVSPTNFIFVCSPGRQMTFKFQYNLTIKYNTHKTR